MDVHIPIAASLPDTETARLALRRFRAEDLDALAEVFAKPEVWRFPYGRGFSRTETEAFLAGQLEHWDVHGFGCWLAIERETGRVIGYLGLSIPTFLPEVLPAVEVGWRLDPASWGRGYATEGAGMALRLGFERLGLEQICSIPQTGNECIYPGMRAPRHVLGEDGPDPGYGEAGRTFRRVLCNKGFGLGRR